MTLPNILTLLRAALLGPTLAALVYEQTGWAIGLFLLALSSDVLDGWIARRARQVTLLGQLLDPTVDKVYYLALFSTLVALGRGSPWALGLFALPQAGLAVGTVVLWNRREQFAARWPGKVAAGLTALAAGLLILTPFAAPALWAAAAAQVMAGVYYLARQARPRIPEEAGPPPPPTSGSRGG